jgi:PKD repeat protein
MASADVTSGKVILTVNFSSAGSHDPDGTAVSFSWDFGDGAVSSEPNPAHDYTEPGTFIAVLTVTDAQGQTATAQLDITARKTKGKGKP